MAAENIFLPEAEQRTRERVRPRFLNLKAPLTLAVGSTPCDQKKVIQAIFQLCQGEFVHGGSLSAIYAG